jgi:hypothetical protein
MQACGKCGTAGAVETVPAVWEHVPGARDVETGVRAVSVRVHAAAFRVCRFCHLVSRGMVGMLLALLMWATPALAGELYIEGGLGAAFHQSTTDDGTWRQEKVQAPNTRLFDRAWTIGLGYRINERWSVQTHAFNWGETAVKSLFSSDEAYYGGGCNGGSTGAGGACPTAHYKVVDRMWGYDLSVSRYWPINDTAEVYLKGGGAIAFHELKWTGPNSDTYGPTRVRGTIPMLVVGGGACYGYVCADTTLYQGTLSMNGGCIGGEYDCGYPLSKQVVTTMVVFKLPLTGWR